MPVGPNGERRPDDDVECAHKVFQLAVGEIIEEPSNRTLLTLTPLRHNGVEVPGIEPGQVGLEAPC